MSIFKIFRDISVKYFESIIISYLDWNEQFDTINQMIQELKDEKERFFYINQWKLNTKFKIVSYKHSFTNQLIIRLSINNKILKNSPSTLSIHPTIIKLDYYEGDKLFHQISHNLETGEMQDSRNIKENRSGIVKSNINDIMSVIEKHFNSIYSTTFTHDLIKIIEHFLSNLSPLDRDKLLNEFRDYEGFRWYATAKYQPYQI